MLEREHVPAYHTTGRSAALHSETYGSAEIRAITVASGRFYRKPPAGFADHPLLTPRGALIAGRAEQQADMQKAAAEFARLVPSVRWLDPAEVLRRQPLLKPEAAAGGAIFEPEADDMDVAAIHGGFLQGRARGRRRAASRCRGDRRSSAATAAGTIGLRDGETIAATNIVNASGAWADVVGGLAGAAAGRPGAQAAHRLHLRFAGRARPRAHADGRSTSTRAGTSSPRSASSWARRPTRRRRRRATRSPRRSTSPPPSSASRRRRRCSIHRIKNKWAGLRSFVADKNLVVGYDADGRGLLLAGRPGRLRHPDRRGGRPAGRQPGAGQGPARRHRRAGRSRSGTVADALHATVIERSRAVAKA